MTNNYPPKVTLANHHIKVYNKSEIIRPFLITEHGSAVEQVSMPTNNPVVKARILFVQAEEYRRANNLPSAMHQYLEAAKLKHPQAILWFAEINLGTPDIKPDPGRVLGLLNTYQQGVSLFYEDTEIRPFPARYHYLYARALQLQAPAPDNRQTWAAIRLNYEEAVKGGHTQSMIELGHLERDGKGGPRRPFRALSLYARAADLNDNQARKVLRKFISSHNNQLLKNT